MDEYCCIHADYRKALLVVQQQDPALSLPRPRSKVIAVAATVNKPSILGPYIAIYLYLNGPESDSGIYSSHDQINFIWHCGFLSPSDRAFDHPSRERCLTSSLLQMRQGIRSMAAYTIDFRTVAASSGWNEQALQAAYVQGLSEELKDELADRDPPNDLEALYELVIRLDNRLQERRAASGVSQPNLPTLEESVDLAGVPEDYWDLQMVFSKHRAQTLPPHRPLDCAINLLPGAAPPRGRLFSLSPPEQKAMDEYIQEALSLGFIRPSTLPASAGFFFVKQKDGSQCPCIDYCGVSPKRTDTPCP
ncbi:hypothetical protein QTP70_012622 [Hemibagrus guttatus]|uniref:Retrotransposon gag domain-containing protein n=1 Tax=Hemibagrus guttatus TaxID=175788 RepID=A0AAE0UTV7_9TELE|nr:hypothetical protein QTP70_012622 [Hemibagrus guttatus]